MYYLRLIANDRYYICDTKTGVTQPYTIDQLKEISYITLKELRGMAKTNPLLLALGIELSTVDSVLLKLRVIKDTNTIVKLSDYNIKLIETNSIQYCDDAISVTPTIVLNRNINIRSTPFKGYYRNRSDFIFDVTDLTPSQKDIFYKDLYYYSLVKDTIESKTERVIQAIYNRDTINADSLGSQIEANLINYAKTIEMVNEKDNFINALELMGIHVR